MSTIDSPAACSRGDPTITAVSGKRADNFWPVPITPRFVADAICDNAAIART
jgi:hypothetical protein